jgi:hypothetical protein
LPSAYAFAVFSWEPTANASARSLVSCGNRSCRFSAVLPMLSASMSTILGEEARVGVDALAHRVAAHVLDAARQATS